MTNDPGSPRPAGSPAFDAIRVVGRYALHREIAAGGMATVHLGRLLGPVGFSRTVAIKRLHPQFAREPEFVSMFLDEARLAARIRHPNVVSTLDVVAAEGEIFLVMEYIQGEALSKLIRFAAARKERIPARVVASIVVGCLHGLHAAHEARDERGAPLDIVHRDVSPQNMLVGVDGVPHLLDFGIARAAGRLVTTREGEVKGKFAYMAPEQFHGEAATRKSDIFGAAIVLWETLACERLFHGETDAAVLEKILFGAIPSVRARHPELPESIDAVLARGLARAAGERYATAREMALAIEESLGVASPTEVATWLERTASESLLSRAAVVAAVESSSTPAAGHPLPAVAHPPAALAHSLPAVPHSRESTSVWMPARPMEPAEPKTAMTDQRAEDVRRRRRANLLIASSVVAMIASGAGYAVVARRSATAPLASAAPLPLPLPLPPSPSAAEASTASASAPPASGAAVAPLPLAPSATTVVAPPPRTPRSTPRSPAQTAPAKGLKGLPTDRE